MGSKALVLENSTAKQKLVLYYEPLKEITGEEYMEDDEMYPEDLKSLQRMLIQLNHIEFITMDDTYDIASEFGILGIFESNDDNMVSVILAMFMSPNRYNPKKLPL